MKRVKLFANAMALAFCVCLATNAGAANVVGTLIIQNQTTPNASTPHQVSTPNNIMLDAQNLYPGAVLGTIIETSCTGGSSCSNFTNIAQLASDNNATISFSAPGPNSSITFAVTYRFPFRYADTNINAFGSCTWNIQIKQNSSHVFSGSIPQIISIPDGNNYFTPVCTVPVTPVVNQSTGSFSVTLRMSNQ